MDVNSRFFIVVGLLLFSYSDFAKTGVYPLLGSDCKIMYANNVITEANPVPCSRLSGFVFDLVDFNNA